MPKQVEVLQLTSVSKTVNGVTFTSGQTKAEPKLNIKHNLKSKWKEIWENVTIEPMTVLQIVALSSLFVNVQNYYIDSICMQEFGNQILCSNLTAPQNKGKEIIVEGIASHYATYRSLIDSGFPIIFSLFLGSWSDKHGSKLPMILSLFGYTVTAVIYTCFAYMPRVHPGFLLIASIPSALTGGLIALIVSSFRYIADITTEENRSFRIAMVEGCWAFGYPVGLLGSSQVLKYGGYHSVFLISTILYGLALLYTIFVVKNDRPQSSFGVDSSDMLKDMFDITALKNTVRTCFRKRPGNERDWIILLLITICIRVLSLFGLYSMTFLYSRNKFGWNNQDYSTFSTADGLLSLTGSGLAVLILMKILKISDAAIGLFSSTSCFVGALVFTISSTGWMMYLSVAVMMFCGLMSTVQRSMLSKFVSKDEVGKVYSLLATGEATMPLISAPLYNFIYMETVSTFPGAVFLLSSFLNLLILLVFVYFFIALKNYVPHSKLEEENAEPETEFKD